MMFLKLLILLMPDVLLCQLTVNRGGIPEDTSFTEHVSNVCELTLDHIYSFFGSMCII